MTIMPSAPQPAPGKFARAFSAQVRSSMARKRISGAQLAEMTGRSQSYVSKRLRDEASFSANDCEVICVALGEDLLEFVTATIRSMGD
jgi:transcriptional regulator with XRE-family HTH domain